MSDPGGAEGLRQATRAVFQDFHPKTLAIAVSGGGDSMALLDLMIDRGRADGFAVRAVTVDHGLRAEAAEEIAAVAAFCAQRAVPHDVLCWHWDGTGNLQAAARDARYRLMAAWATGSGVDAIALGHTRDDQAETFLMRLARASGVDGLAEMERRFDRHGITWLRPLLSVGRAELRDHLHQAGIPWHEDATNDDPRFERVRMRQALQDLAPLGVDAEVLAQVSQNLSSARDALALYTKQAAQAHVSAEAGDVILDAAPDLPAEIRRRLMVAALRYVSGADYAPRSAALAEVDAALESQGRATLHGCLITRSDPQIVRITREWAVVKGETSPMGEAWDRRWHMAGPKRDGLTVAALGEDGLKVCPDWRETGLPRASLVASPAVWDGDILVSAPLAGLANGYTATLRPTFDEFLDTH